MSVLLACVPPACLVPRGQKIASDPLEHYK